MSCKSLQERKEGFISYFEVLEEFGSRRSPGWNKSYVVVPIVECQIQKHRVHRVEVSANARRDKFCRLQPDFLGE